MFTRLMAQAHPHPHPLATQNPLDHMRPGQEQESKQSAKGS